MFNRLLGTTPMDQPVLVSERGAWSKLGGLGGLVKRHPALSRACLPGEIPFRSPI